MTIRKYKDSINKKIKQAKKVEKNFFFLGGVIVPS